METGRTPMEEAEAQLYRRIQELRTRARGDQPVPDVVPESRPAMPDLRTILARAETHVDELRTTAAALEENLPAKVERAVERACRSTPTRAARTSCESSCAGCRGRSSR